VDVISFMGRKNLFLRRRRVRNRFCANISLVRNLSNHFRRPMLNLNSFLGTDPDADINAGCFSQDWQASKFSKLSKLDKSNLIKLCKLSKCSKYSKFSKLGKFGKLSKHTMLTKIGML